MFGFEIVLYFFLLLTQIIHGNFMSPHFGLMDPSTMTMEDAMLMRAKLHWRCGTRRMQQNKTSAGLTTLYDAFLSGMRWYILSHLENEIDGDKEEKLENERFVFAMLRKEGIIDGSLDLNLIEESVDKALMDKDVQEDQDTVMSQMEGFLTRIGILPFDESKLPPEDPSTF